jgi:acetyltransferase
MDVAMQPSFGDLTPLIAPRSIAVIGASDRAGNLGGVAVANLAKFGFRGSVWPVNPGRTEVGGLPCFPDVRSLPGTPDLAIVALPADAVAAALRECGEAGIKAAIVWAGGFAEVGESGRALQSELEDVCRASGIKLCGPNCLGIVNWTEGMVASFGSMFAETESVRPGAISMVSQSGGISGTASILAQRTGSSFRVTISCGNEAVLSLSDFMHALALDEETRVIAAYVEGIADPDKFIAALAEARRRGKTVVILKGGASSASERAALAHTGKLAGADRTYEAIFREFSVVRVHSITELVDVCRMLETAGHIPAASRKNVVLTTFGGGTGVLNADQCVMAGMDVPRLSAETQAKLKDLLPPIASFGNPVDLTPQAITDPKYRDLLAQALTVLLDAPETDYLLFMVSGMEHRAADILDIVEQATASSPKPICLSWMLAGEATTARLREKGLFAFEEHSRAAAALGRLAQNAYNRANPVARSEQTLPSFDWAAHLGKIPENGVISEHVVAGILREAALPSAEGRIATVPGDVADIVETLGFPLVAKGISPDVTHRAKAGLLKLGIETLGDVERADGTFRQIAAEWPLRYDGTWIQQMVTERGSELIVSALYDREFGVLIGCGVGGNLTEIIDDMVFARAPIEASSAVALMRSLRTCRKHPDFLSEAQMRSAAEWIARFSLLAATAPWKNFNLEVNPLLISQEASRAVDGLLVIATDELTQIPSG